MRLNRKYFLFSIMPALVLFAGTEIILRVADFKYSPSPLEMRSLAGDPMKTVDQVIRYNNRDGVVRFIKDARQLWKPKDSPLEKYPESRTEGVSRLAALGCSCTARCVGTEETYPSLAEKLLIEKRGRKVEVLNAGVGSFSSFQGLRRFQYEVLKFRPDILTVFFGWNDHWIAAIPDHEQKIKSDFQIALINFLENFRIYQAGNFIRSRLGRAKGEAPQLTLRVPLDQYEKNLAEIVRIGREHGMKVLLMTAPYDFSDWQPTNFFPFPREQVEAVHRSYNVAVRRLGSRLNVPVLDLEEIVRKEPPGSVLSSDGVHYHAGGCAFIGRALAEKILALGWLEK